MIHLLAGMVMASGGLASELPRMYTAGMSLKNQGIALSGWGSGTARETDETALEGTTSIRISSQNYFQGGVIYFQKPVDLTPSFADKAALLRIAFRTPDSLTIKGGTPVASNTPRPPAGVAGRGGATGIPPGVFGASGVPPGIAGPSGAGSTGKESRTGPTLPSGIPPGVFGASGVPPGIVGRPPTGVTGPTGGGYPGASPTGAANAAPKLKTLRVVVHTTDGKVSEEYVDINGSYSLDRGWTSLTFPLSSIRGFDQTNKTVSWVAISADTSTTVYVGDIRMVDDTTPINAEFDATTFHGAVAHNGGKLNLALGDGVKFEASAYGGSTLLKYSWDFDSSDGIQEDATGPTVKRTFRTAGTFVVTCTVSDKYGLKPPYVCTLTVTVNP